MLSIAHRTTQINQTLLFMTKKITSRLSSRDSVQYWKNPRERKLYKQAKYTELRAGIKRLHKVKEIRQILCCVRLPGSFQQNFRGGSNTGGTQTVKKVI